MAGHYRVLIFVRRLCKICIRHRFYLLCHLSAIQYAHSSIPWSPFLALYLDLDFPRGLFDLSIRLHGPRFVYHVSELLYKTPIPASHGLHSWHYISTLTSLEACYISAFYFMAPVLFTMSLNCYTRRPFQHPMVTILGRLLYTYPSPPDDQNTRTPYSH